MTIFIATIWLVLVLILLNHLKKKKHDRCLEMRVLLEMKGLLVNWTVSVVKITTRLKKQVNKQVRLKITVPYAPDWLTRDHLMTLE